MSQAGCSVARGVKQAFASLQKKLFSRTNIERTDIDVNNAYINLDINLYALVTKGAVSPITVLKNEEWGMRKTSPPIETLLK